MNAKQKLKHPFARQFREQTQMTQITQMFSELSRVPRAHPVREKSLFLSVLSVYLLQEKEIKEEYITIEE